MRKTTASAAVICALMAFLVACDRPADSEKSQPSASPTAPPTTVNPAEHEAGPESPIAFGLQVPRGAAQVGPLIRFRSAALIEAYMPQLEAAQARKEAEEQEKIAEAMENGDPLPTPKTTPITRPSDDTFKLIERPPKPDSTISLMRIDGDPSQVVRRMLAQIAAVLPDAGIVTDDLSSYCRSVEERVSHCSLTVQGLAEDQREIRISLKVDPGDLATRTSSPGALTRPIMKLEAQFAGDPVFGQEADSSRQTQVPKDVDGEDASGLIWPKMDIDALSTSQLMDSWRAPLGSSILLSSSRPPFVALATEHGRDADAIASDFVSERAGKATVTKDVVEDLNEISTTYTAVKPDGRKIQATYVLSARGNYAALFTYPASKAGKNRSR